MSFELEGLLDLVSGGKFRFGSAIVIGGLTGGPAEMTFTPGGQAVTTLSVAVSEGSGKAATWYQVKVWGKGAGALNGAADKKGLRVWLLGHPERRDWVSHSGKVHTDLVVYADFLALAEKGAELRVVPLEARVGEVVGIQV